MARKTHGQALKSKARRESHSKGIEGIQKNNWGREEMRKATGSQHPPHPTARSARVDVGRCQGIQIHLHVANAKQGQVLAVTWGYHHHTILQQSALVHTPGGWLGHSLPFLRAKFCLACFLKAIILGPLTCSATSASTVITPGLDAPKFRK